MIELDKYLSGVSRRKLIMTEVRAASAPSGDKYALWDAVAFVTRRRIIDGGVVVVRHRWQIDICGGRRDTRG